MADSSMQMAAGGVRRLGWLVVSALLLASGVALWVSRHRAEPQRPVAEQKPAPSGVERTNLMLVEGRLHRPGESQPFTGVLLEHDADGRLRSRSLVVQGKLHGLSEGWYTNGQLQVQESFQAGVSHGSRTKWHPNGAKLSEAGIVDGRLQGMFRRWHDNGQLAEQVEFVAGRPEGESLAYFPSGHLKARVMMRDGQPVSQTFWRDGEMKELASRP